MARRLPAGRVTAQRPAPLLIPALAALLATLAGCQPPAPEQAAPLPAPRGPVPIRVSADPRLRQPLAEVPVPEVGASVVPAPRVGGEHPRVGGDGTGTAPAPAFMAGLYLNEALVTLPPVAALRIESGGRVYGAEAGDVKAYRQELRLREGLLVTRATWDTGAGDAQIELETALLHHQPDVALVRLKLDNTGTAPVSVGVPATPLGEGGAASQPSPGLLRREGSFGGQRVVYTQSLRPLGRAETRPQDPATLQYQVPAGQSERFLLATLVQGGPHKPRTALASLPTLTEEQGERWLAAHRQAWARLWESGIEIEGDPEAQEVVRACTYHLLANVREDVPAGVPPMGLSDPAFNGHVFWDMESWMLPALLPQHPALARAMLQYRHRTLPGARANARAEGLPGAAYAWESASTGKETFSGEYRHGRHVTGDVALALKQYYQATGDREWLRSVAWPILRETADNWAARAKPDGRGGFVVRQVTTPDELAGRVDHSAWTHHVARVNLEFAAETARLLGQPVNPRWQQVARGLGFLRRPDGLIVAHSGFEKSGRAKQADVLLLAHPGEAKLSLGELGRLYDYYAPRVIANGPAMTDAVHAIVAARLGRDEEALERFRESYRPFVRPPYHFFSEKRTRDNVYFATGAGGVVEAVLYGFGGLRLEPDPKHPDRPRLEPHVPKEWKSLGIRGLRWRDRVWDVRLVPGQPPVWTPHRTATVQ